MLVPDYHLTYLQEENRLLLWADDHQTSALLTRRMTGALLGALAKAMDEQKSGSAVRTAAAREAVLSFEHSKAVSQAHAEGRARVETRKRPDRARWKLVTAVDIVGTNSGRTQLKFRNSEEQVISLNLNAEATYVLMSSISDIAERAEWGLSALVAWMSSIQEPQGATTLH